MRTLHADPGASKSAAVRMLLLGVYGDGGLEHRLTLNPNGKFHGAEEG